MAIPDGQTVWSKLGVQRSVKSVAGLMGDVANITVATKHRYVWRGVKDAHYPLLSALERRLRKSNIEVTANSIRAHDADLIRRASDARLRSDLSDAELLALLQHAGAATSLLDVTPDPFIGLFFATEPAGENGACALMAIRVPGAAASQDRFTFKGPLPNDAGGSGSIHDRLRSLLSLPEETTDPILWEAPFVDDRMKAQRGMFLATTAPPWPIEYGSFDLALQSKSDEMNKVDHVCNRDKGNYNRPTIVIFYIPAKLRIQVANELDSRFGYRTETIYPDLPGFALANGPTRSLASLPS